MGLQPAGNNTAGFLHKDSVGGFCHDALWDSGLSWYTLSSRPPDLTDCFKWTILIWIPAIFLAICLPFYCTHYVRHRRRRRHYGHGPKTAAYMSTTTAGGGSVDGADGQRPQFIQSKNFMHSPSFAAKIACYVILIGAAAVQWVDMVFDDNSSAAAITGGCMEIATLFVAVTITVINQQQLRRTSGILFCLFGLVFVAHSARFYSAFINYFHFNETSSLSFVCETLMFGASALLAVLHCFADTYGRIPYDKNETPRATASFLSRLTFTWLTPVLWRTWRKSTPLEQSDLWTLEPQNHSQHIYTTWDRCWQSEIKRAEGLIKRDGPRVTKQIIVPQQVPLIQKNHDHVSSKNEVENEPETIESSARVTPVPAGATKPTQKHEPSLHRAMFNMIKQEFFISACTSLCYITTVFVVPLLLKALIQSVVDPRSKLWQGVLIAALLCVATILGSVLDQQGNFLQWCYALRLRSATIAAVYRKAMRISNDTRQKYTVGELVNFVAVDAENIFRFPMWGTAFVIHAPTVIVVATIFLIHELGWAALAGVASMAVIMPLNGWAANIQRKYYAAQLARKDERIRLTSEVLNGIKFLKFYAWEAAFVGRLNAIRRKELILLRKAAILQAISLTAWDLSPFFVSLLSFGAFVLASPDNILTVEKAFVSLLLINILSVPLALLPTIIQMLTQFLVSVERVRRFLLSDELSQIEHSNSASQPNLKDDVVRITNASFGWSKTSANNKPVLADISLQIQTNSLTAIVGHVGAGKSSLCAAVLGQLDRLDSSETATPVVYIADISVAYVPQQAWIQNASVRDNILFGRTYDAELYEQVLDACALLPDLEMFPARDATEIGEKGLNLSGGQKQRVSLARAAYSDAQLVVLDDPLSAVDAHVAKHIFEKLLSNNTGLLRHKTRILATHSIGFLPHVDQIIVLDHGRIAERGTYRELLVHNGAFAVFLRNYLNDPASTSAEDDVVDENTAHALATAAEALAGDALVTKSSIRSAQVPIPIGTLPHSLAAGDNANKLVRRQISRQTTIDTVKSRKCIMDQTMKEPEKPVMPDGDKEDGRLLAREATSRLRVHNSLYVMYARFASYSRIGLTLLFFVTYAGINSVSRMWLARWSAAFTAYEQQGYTIDRHRESLLISERNYYLLVYVLLGSGQVVFFLASVVTFALTATRASQRLHSTMLDRIIHAPMSFFDTTPTGRILNRFSKDLDAIDVTLPQSIQGCLECAALVGTAFLVVLLSSPWFIAAIPVLIIMYWAIQRFFVTTNCQLRRLELIGRGPLLSFFTETMLGVHVVRAMQAHRRFIREFESHLDYAATPLFCMAVCSRWISMHSSVVGAFCILTAAMCVLVFKENVVGDAVAASVLGLVLTSAISITGPMQWGLRLFSQIDTDIVSVERIDEYSKVEQEKRVGSGPLPSLQWPEHGKIEFNKYKTRYRPGLRLVLNGITAQVEPGEKLGIVGRTGAGKSSLTMALFRLIESSGDSNDQDGTLRGSENGGYIAIDGVNIAQLSLDTLRSRLTILPQDPMLFSGTLRLNLDPAGAYSDDKVWEALEHAHLKSWVKSHAEGLEFVVAEEGSNMSVGQRQLVCLARALLRKTRVLVLDEATAAVDVETDELIQTTIRREFVHATVLSIAHRIKTILDYDRIMVMDGGKVKEIGAPSELLRDEQSEFSRLARDANIKGGPNE